MLELQLVSYCNSKNKHRFYYKFSFVCVLVNIKVKMNGYTSVNGHTLPYHKESAVQQPEVQPQIQHQDGHHHQQFQVNEHQVPYEIQQQRLLQQQHLIQQQRLLQQQHLIQHQQHQPVYQTQPKTPSFLRQPFPAGYSVYQSQFLPPQSKRATHPYAYTRPPPTITTTPYYHSKY